VSSLLRQIRVGVLMLLVATVLLGVVYPFAVTGVAYVIARNQAQGSLVSDASGQVIGSQLIGQNFTGAQWFQPRPSAAGSNGYDPQASGGTNLGPNNPDLVKAVTGLKAQIAAANHVSPDAVPADAVTSSGSGLDPDISPQYALLQVDRVARARGLDPGVVRQLVQDHTQGRQLGFIGEPRVNVLMLNLALAALPR